MWLLDTSTYRLHYFLGAMIPEYAILSHRWGEQEVSFAYFRDCQMVEDGLSGSSKEEEELFPDLSRLREYRTKRLKSLKGWEKVERLCKKSRAYHLSWAWIDTACIDKSSSAELQEAINSMFAWYQNAKKCFVYMSDVWVDPKSSPGAFRRQFCSSSWFSRAWTLQELLAPPGGTIIFLNSRWDHIGLDTVLLDDISAITNIPHAILSSTRTKSRNMRIRNCSIAQRMSWAAKRQVSRGEDVAYSLLGLFDVNMPMLYGEGRFQAFERLQLEITKKSTDETILAWNKPDFLLIWHLLATSPSDFADSSTFKVPSMNFELMLQLRGSPLQMNQRGLLMEAILIDRHSNTCVPKTLRDEEGVHAQFALPLLSDASKQASQADKEVSNAVIVPLSHLHGFEYIRMGLVFTAELNWAELANSKKPERICICS